MKKKKELQKKISEASRFRSRAVVGLFVGIASVILGILLSLPALFIIGYTVFIICTGVTFFLTTLKWQYSKALAAEMKQEAKPPRISRCPRCGTETRKNTEYCPKCGKKIQTKKR